MRRVEVTQMPIKAKEAYPPSAYRLGTLMGKLISQSTTTNDRLILGDSFQHARILGRICAVERRA